MCSGTIFWGLQRPHSDFNPLGDVELRTGPIGSSADGNISLQRTKKEKKKNICHICKTITQHTTISNATSFLGCTANAIACTERKDVASCSVVCQSLCWTQPSALQKRINQSRCCMGCGLRWAPGTTCYVEVQIPQGKGSILGVLWPTEMH